MPRVLPSLPHQLGVVTTEQALAVGWTESALRNAVRAGVLDRLWRGVYAPPVRDTAAGRAHRIGQRSVAAALTNPGARVSHLGAAEVNGWPWWAPSPRPCVTVAPGCATAVPGVHVHRSEMAPADRWREAAVLLTSPARTAADVAREFGTEAGLVVADAALRSGVVGRDDLERATRDAAGRRHVERAREVLRLADPLAESVLESRSRYRMHTGGLPPPWTQVDIRRLDGTWLARVDFYWDEFGVVGEADGDLKYDERGDLVREKRREDLLRELGLGVVRWGWRDLAPFEPTVRKLWRAVDQGETRLRRRWTAHPSERCAERP